MTAQASVALVNRGCGFVLVLSALELATSPFYADIRITSHFERRSQVPLVSLGQDVHYHDPIIIMIIQSTDCKTHCERLH